MKRSLQDKNIGGREQTRGRRGDVIAVTPLNNFRSNTFDTLSVSSSVERTDDV